MQWYPLMYSTKHWLLVCAFFAQTDNNRFNSVYYLYFSDAINNFCFLVCFSKMSSMNPKTWMLELWILRVTDRDRDFSLRFRYRHLWQVNHLCPFMLDASVYLSQMSNQDYLLLFSVADPGFPQGGSATLQVAWTHDFAIFSQQL